MISLQQPATGPYYLSTTLSQSTSRCRVAAAGKRVSKRKLEFLILSILSRHLEIQYLMGALPSNLALIELPDIGNYSIQMLVWFELY
jgi:hypothetical protein